MVERPTGQFRRDGEPSRKRLLIAILRRRLKVGVVQQNAMNIDEADYVRQGQRTVYNIPSVPRKPL